MVQTTGEEPRTPDFAGFEIDVREPITTADLLTCCLICSLSAALSLGLIALAARSLWRFFT